MLVSRGWLLKNLGKGFGWFWYDLWPLTGFHTLSPPSTHLDSKLDDFLIKLWHPCYIQYTCTWCNSVEKQCKIRPLPQGGGLLNLWRFHGLLPVIKISDRLGKPFSWFCEWPAYVIIRPLPEGGGLFKFVHVLSVADSWASSHTISQMAYWPKSRGRQLLLAKNKPADWYILS